MVIFVPWPVLADHFAYDLSQGVRIARYMGGIVFGFPKFCIANCTRDFSYLQEAPNVSWVL